MLLAAALAAGVPLQLAQQRAALIQDLRYELRFEVPASTAQPVTGSAVIRFKLKSVPDSLALDFAGAPGEHIVFGKEKLKAGENRLELPFKSADGPLNRRPDLLYTLLVPARARELFPCFDQPDLKARYSLTLALPPSWTAVANGAELSREGGVWRFAETEPLSTYHFAFAAGRWSVETRGKVRLFHREDDPAKAAEGVDAVFALAGRARKWMEEYTGIPMPYAKLDLVAVPGFQYGGMEHPGALYLNAKKAFPGVAATEEERLQRASLVAHEIAHLWFGDLVTMRWFDDVWLKEVFANFMADKIVAPEFPGVDHHLRFLLSRHPFAYEVERTRGASAIRQPLDNLDRAGQLYTPIVYNKSPVVMRQLEARLGERGMRDGLRDYLRRHRYGNADFDELIAALSPRDAGDLRAWSRKWVSEPGRPRVAFEGSLDPAWEQVLEPASGPGWRLADRRGLGYARVLLDEETRRTLLSRMETIAEPATRGVAWLALWDDAMDGTVAPEAFLDALERALAREREELLLARLLRWHRQFWWRFLEPERRAARGPALESLLWSRLESAPGESLKKAFFNAYRQSVVTAAGARRLEALWRREGRPAGLRLDDEDETLLAWGIALRRADGAPDVLDAQLARLSNPDRRARFAFVRPALSPDPAVRKAWFDALKTPEGRRSEDWVYDGLLQLHHALREREALPLLGETLRLLPEVQAAGDIFFPQHWLEAALHGHGSPRAADEARAALESGGFDARLRALFLRHLDELEAAARARR